MSSVQLNLSSLPLTARERLAHLDAAGGALWARLLSPPPGDASRPATAPSAYGTNVHFAPSAVTVVGASVSMDPVALLGVGDSGEFSLARGVAGGLTAFVMTPDLLEHWCCRAVAGGVKFCTLGSDSCTFSTHMKKAEVFKDHIWVNWS
jgi:hypothetical protein